MVSYIKYACSLDLQILFQVDLFDFLLIDRIYFFAMGDTFLLLCLFFNLECKKKNKDLIVFILLLKSEEYEDRLFNYNHFYERII